VRAYVRLQTPDGQSVALGPGDIIGRLSSAALQLDDGRISEAHAMVSLRGRELKLLGLRGLFAVDGQPVREVVLAEGMVLKPAKGLTLLVEEVALPLSVLAIEGEGLPRHLLTGTVSIVARPQLSLWPRFRDDAVGTIWSNGEEWRLRLGSQPARTLQDGDVFSAGGKECRVVAVALDRAGHSPTVREGAINPALHIVARFDTVHIHAEGALAVTLDGLQARLVSELAALGGPASWEVVAGELWRDGVDRDQQRGRWDVLLARLRRRLREHHLRPDLVRTGGAGQVELYLQPGDRLEELS
jgi:hypothetical protein